nr:LuxR C-terminal-related transcriptional regulator [Streptomyces hydrogenans]
MATTLTVSVKTVEATLTRVYRKLGLHSRFQLAHHRHTGTRVTRDGPEPAELTVVARPDEHLPSRTSAPGQRRGDGPARVCQSSGSVSCSVVTESAAIRGGCGGEEGWSLLVRASGARSVWSLVLKPLVGPLL